MQTQKRFAPKPARALAAIALLAIFAGCSLHQDPYADQPEEVKNAGPMTPVEKTKSPDAMSPSSLRIQFQPEDSLEFKEGVESKVTIKGSVMMDVNGHDPVLGQDYQLSIDNIADFPGASWDASTGEFKWTPTVGYVQSEYTRNVHLNVTLRTFFGTKLTAQKSIIGVITRAELDPTIESIDDLTMNPVKEGEVRDFKVVVRDPHADDRSADTKPRLTIVSDGSGASSASNLIYCAGYKGCTDPEKDPNDPQRYTFKLRADLQNKEVTLNRSTLSFGVMATSRFGEASAVKKANIVIVSQIQDPQISWSAGDAIQVVAGRENTVNFTVFDPGSDGQLSVSFDTRCDLTLGPNATCSCQTLGRLGTTTQLCTISWAVPAQPLQTDFQLQFSSHNQSRDGSQVKNTPFQRTLHVIQPAGGNPPPGSGPIHTIAPAQPTGSVTHRKHGGGQ